MQTSAPSKSRPSFRFLSGDGLIEACLAASALLAFTPTFVKLANGAWRTEQEGHGPLIILAAAWLAWTCVPRLRSLPRASAPLAGWLLLLAGLATLVVTRSQDVTMIEVAAQIPIIAGCVLIARGWAALRVLAFPIVFLVFSIPPPGWMMDAFTVPLKMRVSDWVVQLLYEFDYPIAQNGVMIMIGSQELMVKDACAGMNSILALSAIGVFYVHEFESDSKARAAILILSIVPITIAANFVRVLLLVLIAHHFGPDAIEGVVHDMTGLALFVVALALFFLLDALIVGLSKLPKLVAR